MILGVSLRHQDINLAPYDFTCFVSEGSFGARVEFSDHAFAIDNDHAVGCIVQDRTNPGFAVGELFGSICDFCFQTFNKVFQGFAH